MKRFSRNEPCPICGGHKEMAQHQGVRCWGGILPDGKAVVCTREDRAGLLKYNDKTAGYHHYLDGHCKCGVDHSGVSLPPKVVSLAKRTFYPVLPVPDYAEAPSFEHRDFPWGHAAAWAYRDRAGHVLYYRVRFNRPDGGKDVLPYTYGSYYENATRNRWNWKQPPGKLTLYGLELFAQRPDADVLVCEGEKATDAGRLIFPDKIVVTWPGGAKNIDNADWSPLAGRNVTFWPDADKEGIDAAKRAANLALRAGAWSACLVDLPEGLPHGWDLADALAEGMAVAL